MPEGRDFKDTLKLPSTGFPMKANLAQREPEILAAWDRDRMYERMVEAAQGRGDPFLLHDGPPYANGNIHHGHILNKVLKDIVVKMRNMSGHPCTLVPGWDCHGLPIEHAVEKEIGRDQARADPSGLRKKCRAFATRWVDSQRDEFRRLGVLADWDHPYLTMTPDYEALIAREFGRFVGTGSVYQGRKPVLWCHVCETALADAEVEYKDASSPSIYVRFPFTPSVGEKVPELAGRKGSVVIWTTTPWTLPANLAISLDPKATYVAEEVGDEVLIVAEALQEAFHAATGLPAGTVITRFTGDRLERAACRHPFIDRESLLIVGEHVTMDTGTGCVHTAPGFGEDDFVVGQRYGLPVYAPVNGQGRFTAEVPEFAGRVVFSCDADIIALLRDRGMLVQAGTFSHPYPHCWRSKNPVIFRATPQWFIRVDDDAALRQRALDAIADVTFIPAWGRDRISGMLHSRPDWCVSRQRHWGVPIVGVACKACGHVQTSQTLIDHVADIFEAEGADAWFDRTLPELVPPGTCCDACGSTDLDKVRDILDVWFDSGVSYAAVMEPRHGKGVRTDLYLEGSDQHRGWFQSSLLASVGTRKQAPFKAVLTHGFVVDGNGRKLAKSEGNYIAPEKTIQANGADLLRLWTASEDYRDDIRLSDEILKRLVEAYRKIRNTSRFMLGVVSDLTIPDDLLPDDDLLPQDRWALVRFGTLVGKVRTAYEAYEFHGVCRMLLDFLITDLSAFYLDIGKDRLYCAAPSGHERRSIQTAVYRILDGLLRLLAPVLSFTAEEAYGFLPKPVSAPTSVFLTPLPSPADYPSDPVLQDTMDRFLAVRAVVLKALEEARTSKRIGHPLEAAVTVRIVSGSGYAQALAAFGSCLAELFVVSQVTVETVDQLGPDMVAEAVIDAARGGRCQRCWNYHESVIPDGADAGLCTRCAAVIASGGH